MKGRIHYILIGANIIAKICKTIWSLDPDTNVDIFDQENRANRGPNFVYKFDPRLLYMYCVMHTSKQTNGWQYNILTPLFRKLG